MRYCEKCNVSVRGDIQHCPLCQHPLTGAPEDPCYPIVETVYQKYQSIFRMLLLAAIILGIISVAINLMIPDTGNWSVFVLLGLACLGLFVYIGVRKINNIPYFITNQAFIAVLVSIAWDWLSDWNGWSINYVVPAACIIAMMTLTVIVFFHRISVADYIVWLTADAVFGIIPLVFYLTGILYTKIPTLICIAMSAISLSAIWILKGKDIRHELTKRFHI